MAIMLSKSFIDNYWHQQNEVAIEKARKGEQASFHKYIYRRETGNKERPYIYVWLEDLLKNPVKTLFGVFNISDKKTDELYKASKAKEDYGADKKTFAQHLLEYMCHRSIWDKRFSKKENADKLKKPVKMETAEKISVAGMETPEPESNQLELFSEKKKDSEFKANPYLMRKIWAMYTGKDVEKQEQQKKAVENVVQNNINTNKDFDKTRADSIIANLLESKNYDRIRDLANSSMLNTKIANRLYSEISFMNTDYGRNTIDYVVNKIKDFATKDDKELRKIYLKEYKSIYENELENGVNFDNSEYKKEYKKMYSNESVENIKNVLAKENENLLISGKIANPFIAEVLQEILDEGKINIESNKKEGYIERKRKETEENLKPKIGKYINDSTGIEANFSGASIDKMSSSKAIEKSKANGFTVDDHFEVVNNILQLWKVAKLVETRPDKNGSNNLLSIKRFDADTVLTSGKNAIAHITVKESVQHGHKLYSVEVMEIEQKNNGQENPNRLNGEAELNQTSTSESNNNTDIKNVNRDTTKLSEAMLGNQNARKYGLNVADNQNYHHNNSEGVNNGTDDNKIESGRISNIDGIVQSGNTSTDGSENVYQATDGSNGNESSIMSNESGIGLGGSAVELGSGRLTKKAAIAVREKCREILKKLDSEITAEDKKILAQYEGAGGLHEENQTDAAILSEFYTPRDVIKKVWELVDKYNPNQNKKVIEPSSGTGRFAEGRTENFTLCELDETSARIAKLLHPDAEVKQGAFQKLFVKNNAVVKEYKGEKYDVAVGNPPYGDYSGLYRGMGEGKIHTRYEEYFMDRTLDTLEDGGIMAFVVPSGFLRNADSKAKQAIAAKGKLLEAWRLPKGTFSSTDVGTDIVVIRKEKGNVEDFNNNKYFEDNPSHVIGYETNDGNWGTAVINRPEGKSIEECIDMIDINATEVDKKIAAVTQSVKVELEPPKEKKYSVRKLEVGAEILDKDGKKGKITYINAQGIGYAFDKGPMGRIPSTEFEVMESDAEEHENRSQAMMGNQNAKKNVHAEPKKKERLAKAKKGDLFTPSTGKNMTASEFNAKYSKNILEKDMKFWKVTDWEGKVETDKLSAAELKELELNKNFIKVDGDYINVVNYASGNIYQKLDELEAIKDDISTDEYELRKSVLDAVIPARKSVFNFTVSPLANFAKLTKNEDGVSLVDQFLFWAGFNEYGNIPYGRKSPISKNELEDGMSMRDIWDYIHAVPVRAEKARDDGDRETAKMFAEQKKKDRRDVTERLFNQWLRQLPESQQKQIEDKWNRTFNTFVNPDYTKIPLFIDGMNENKGTKKFDLTTQQIKGVSQLCNKGNGILAYDVGLGKTACGIVATVNQIQTGKAKKPLICVPKAVYKKWIKEIHQHFPELKINELSNFNEKDLDKFKDAAGNYNLPENVLNVCTYEALQKITFKDETINGELMDDMMDSQSVHDYDEFGNLIPDTRTEREKATQKEKIMTMLGKSAKAKDGAVYWEDLGIDHITVDECFPYNTRVLTPQGWIKIGEIQDKNINQVYSYNIETNNIELKDVLAFMPKKLKHKIVKLNLSNGGYIVCTHNHKIWSVEDGYKEAEQLGGNHVCLLSKDFYSTLQKQNSKILFPDLLDQFAYSAKSGYCNSGEKNCDRSRWPFSHIEEKQNIGSKERQVFDTVRVESVEILESRDYAKYGFRDENDTTVYDITVADNHNFIAEGLLVSNCHNFKNIFSIPRNIGKSSRTTNEKKTDWRGRPIKEEGTAVSNEYSGIAGSSSSRGMKLFAITQLIQRQTNGKGFFGLSATPFNNSPVEIYNILSLVARNRLKDLGIYNLGDFMKEFAEMKPDWKVKANGEAESAQVMKNFKNLSALQNLITEFIDKVDGEEAGVVRPRKQIHKPELDLTPTQKAMLEVETMRMNGYFSQGMEGKPTGDVLVAMNNMRMITLSPSLIDPKFMADYEEVIEGFVPPSKNDIVKESPKLTFVCDLAAKQYKERPTEGQVIYMPRGVEQYDSVKQYLVEQGMPEDSIAFMDSSTTPDKKEQIMEDFNSSDGKIKIIIGSETIKEGVSLNGNSTTIYNTMLGWNPTETIQVEGRIWRQGNKQGITHIVYPLMNDSIDAMMYQKYDEKSSRLDALWSYKGDALNVEDINPEELKFQLIKDPKKRAKMKIQQDQADLKKQKKMLNASYDTLYEQIKDREGNMTVIKNYSEDARKYESKADEIAEIVEQKKKSLAAAKKTKDKDLIDNAQASYDSAKRDLDYMKSEQRMYNNKVKEFQQKNEAIERYWSKQGFNPDEAEQRLEKISNDRQAVENQIGDIQAREADYINEAKIKIAAEQAAMHHYTVEDRVNYYANEIRNNLRPMDDELRAEIRAELEERFPYLKKSQFFIRSGKFLIKL